MIFYINLNNRYFQYMVLYNINIDVTSKHNQITMVDSEISDVLMYRAESIKSVVGLLIGYCFNIKQDASSEFVL